MERSVTNMAEQQELGSSKKSKGLFGKLSFNRKGKMRYKKELLDDEESLMCDDKHETNNCQTVDVQPSCKAEVVSAPRNRRNGKEERIKEGSTLETETMQEPRVIQRKSTDDSSYRSVVQLIDVNNCESETITAAVSPENAWLVTVNAIIESNKGNCAERTPEENGAGSLIKANELYKSDVYLLQSEKTVIASHFDNLSVSHAEMFAVNPADAEHNIEESHAFMSRVKENAIKVDNVEHSPMSEPTSCISTPTDYKANGQENTRKKKKAKRMLKSTKKNKKNSEATSDEETCFHAYSSSDRRDPETIEILTMDTEVNKEKQKKRRKKAKRIAAKVIPL